MADNVGPPQPARFDESGILTIPIIKSAPGVPEVAGTGWIDRNWPVVAVIAAGLVLAVLVKAGKGK